MDRSSTSAPGTLTSCAPFAPLRHLPQASRQALLRAAPAPLPCPAPCCFPGCRRLAEDFFPFALTGVPITAAAGLSGKSASSAEVVARLGAAFAGVFAIESAVKSGAAFFRGGGGGVAAAAAGSLSTGARAGLAPPVARRLPRAAPAMPL